ncbi:MAG: DUF4416 family protein [Deltaproteobacteria bacterium]|nr:DUF4416 family protein [Deltaproteobacteria bacterium]
MSIPQVPEPARLVISVLSARREATGPALSRLTREFGPLEEEVGPLAFTFTSYYDSEMGPGIERWLWVFSDLVDRGRIADMKRLTNEIEQAYTQGGKRVFNLDPGLLTLENFVLATGKNRAHRIYVGQGIFADLTLIYEKKTFRPLPWTYPDYADGRMIGVLNRLRESYKCLLMKLCGRIE